MNADNWATLITGQTGAIIVLAIGIVALWRHHLNTLKEHKEAEAANELRNEKQREDAKISDKETIHVLSNLTKVLESLPGANKELTNEILREIREAVRQINHHTEEHVKPGAARKPVSP